MEKVPLSSKKGASLISTYVVFDAVGLTWVSQWDEPHDVFHMVVDFYQVLIPSSTRCWDGEAALWLAERGIDGQPLLKAHSKLESVQFYREVLRIRPVRYDRESKNALWRETSYASSCAWLRDAFVCNNYLSPDAHIQTQIHKVWRRGRNRKTSPTPTMGGAVKTH